MKTALPKPVLGAGVTATKELSQELGVPEPLAELASFGILKTLPEGSPKISIESKKKPSGLTEKRYEQLKEPTKIPEGKINQINENLEKEFRDISSKIIEKTPLEETYSSLKNNPEFKNQSRELFKDVEKLAENIPGKISTEELKKDLANNLKKDKGTGFIPSEYEKHHAKFMKQLIKETPAKDASALDFVIQYRKNNGAYGEIREPGQSSAYNRAKKDALRDYNVAIAETFEKKYPNSEFSNLFTSSNDRWSKIMDAEAIDSYLDKIFDGKINFKEGEKLLEKQGMQDKFKRALGKEGYKNFEQLTKDLMSKEKAHKMMQVAEKQGFPNLAKSGYMYLISPKLGFAKTGLDIGKFAYKKTWEALLDKPQLSLVWDEGVKAFKKGDFAIAEKKFNILDKEISSEAKRVESLKNFNEKKAEQIVPNLGGIAKGAMDNFYEGILNSLKEGKNTFSGVKDPLISSAKPLYDAGLIKTPEDLKKFAQTIKKP